MHLDGWTLFLQVINFLVLVAILRWALYRPLRKLAEARQARIREAEDAAHAAQAAAEVARRAHESALAEFHGQCRSRLDEAERDADLLRRDAHTRAEQQTAELIGIARRALTEERAAALGWLHAESGRIGARFATRILGAYGPAAVTELTRARACTALAELPDADLQRLAHAGTQLQVSTATDADADERARWQAALLPWIGADTLPGFRVDPALLGGALLEWPGARLDLSWAAAVHNVESDWTAAEATDADADR